MMLLQQIDRAIHISDLMFEKRFYEAATVRIGSLTLTWLGLLCIAFQAVGMYGNGL